MTKAETPEEARQRAIAGVKGVFTRWQRLADHTGYDGFDLKVIRDTKVLDAAAGAALTTAGGAGSSGGGVAPAPSVVATALCSLYIDPSYRNLNGVVHGGAFSLIFDLLTTIALGAVEVPDHWAIAGGVSRTLNVSYLKALPVGVTVHVHSHVTGVGKTLAFLQAWMTSEDGRTVYAACEHHKAFVPSMRDRIKYDLPPDLRAHEEEQRRKRGEAAKL